MLEFTHALTGAAIAYKIQSPAIALPLALLSHFVVDLIPHWNFALDKEKKKHGRISPKTISFLFVDSFLGLFLGLYLAAKALPEVDKSLLVVAGAFLAVLPDLIEAPIFFFNSKNKFINQVLAFQKSHQWNFPFWPGIAIQVIYAAVLLQIALFY